MLLKKRLCEIVASIAIASSILNASCATTPKITFEEYKKPKIIDTAILVAAPRDWYEHLRIPFEGLYERTIVSALEDELEIKGYTITFNATWTDLQTVLKDNKIKTILIAGHGTWTHWTATDTLVIEDMIRHFMYDNKIPRKKGYFIRHTCGDNKYSMINIPLLSEKEEKQIIGTLTSYGAKDICIDKTWTKEDYMFAKPRNRIQYTAKNQTRELEQITQKLNNILAIRGRKREAIAIGTSVVDHPSKTRGYEGINNPFDYLFNPIPDYQPIEERDDDILNDANTKFVTFINRP